MYSSVSYSLFVMTGHEDASPEPVVWIDRYCSNI